MNPNLYLLAILVVHLRRHEVRHCERYEDCFVKPSYAQFIITLNKCIDGMLICDCLSSWLPAYFFDASMNASSMAFRRDTTGLACAIRYVSIGIPTILSPTCRVEEARFVRITMLSSSIYTSMLAPSLSFPLLPRFRDPVEEGIGVFNPSSMPIWDGKQ